jgi:hypothetical protein
MQPTGLRKFHRLTPADAERVLNSQEAIRAMTPEVRQRAIMELLVKKRRLQQVSCSSTWFSDCWSAAATFPPAAETTPMQVCHCARCLRQQRHWPSIYQSPVPVLSCEQDSAHTCEYACESPRPEGESVTASTSPKTSKRTASAEADNFFSYECYLESLDDWTMAQLPSSPSGLALRAIREGRIKLRRQRTHIGRKQRLHIS